MKKEKAKKEKEKYIHVCGKSGMSFALWLQEMLGGDEKCILVDCSADYMLVRYGWKHKPKTKIYTDEKWVTSIEFFERVIFYHEQEDRFTDGYTGAYFFFTRREDIEYVNLTLTKLTSGRLRLIEKTLIPQLKGGEKIHVLCVYNKSMQGEFYVPSYLDKMGESQKNIFCEIFYDSAREWK